MTHTVDRVAAPDTREHGVRRARVVAVSAGPDVELDAAPDVEPGTAEQECAIVDATVPERGTE